MEENNNRNEKDLAMHEKNIAIVAEEISNAMLNNKNKVILSDGKSFIPVELIKAEEKEEKYHVVFGGEKIATLKKGEKVPTDIVRKQIEKYQSSFDFNRMKNGLNNNRNPAEKEKANPQSLKFEKELNEAIKEGRAEKLRMGREITAAGEDLGVLMKKMFGEKAKDVWRVKDKNDSHKFKYIAKNNANEYFDPKGSRANEGTNARQMCWVQDKNGNFKRKTVDDMKVFGRYVIATDIADNALTDDTITLVGQRTPRGEYILMPALDHRIADAPNNANVKDNLARGNSIWEIQDVVMAAELGNRIRGTKLDGKLSADEVEFIRKLQKEGIKDDKIEKIVDALLIVGDLKEQGLRDTAIKALLDSVDTTAKQLEELKKEDYSDEEIKKVMKLVHEGKGDFKQAKETVKNNNSKPKTKQRNKDIEDDDEYVGYGQKRPH